MIQPKRSVIVIIGTSSSFLYLLQRYADRIGYSITVMLPSVVAETICRSEPVAVIFSSVESLEASQSLMADLANCDIPILVCSSVTDQIRTRELGADYCLLHPLTYDSFSAILTSAVTSQSPHSIHGHG
ncbi:MAG: hypothetical protein EHM33_04925 [Chloroflexi bacterium]|nr:MAG: hypothetical protein EHM33_04925 [Chloroflexota bacterium]